MEWLYRLQDRIGITQMEFRALVALLLLYGAGLALEAWNERPRPPDPAAAEKLRAFRSALADTARLEPSRSGSSSSSVAGEAPSAPDGSPRLADHAVQRVDLNRASAEELQELPRVGPRTAERILGYRRLKGGFRSVEELLEIRGIGPKTLEKILPHACVDCSSSASS